jgi:hypothetical protein
MGITATGLAAAHAAGPGTYRGIGLLAVVALIIWLVRRT